MDKIISNLTVYFNEPFWVGVFEKIENGKLSVAKFTFGAEPKDLEVYEFVLKHYYSLRFSPTVTVAVKDKKTNPKRVQRTIKKTLTSSGVGTKSQQALALQHEQNKQERKIVTREQKEAMSKRLFELKQQKKKEKRKGR